MDAETWEAIKDAFGAALDLHPRHRAAYLDALCGGREWLRSEVERLLAQHEAAGDFLMRSLVRPQEAPHESAGRPLFAEGQTIARRFRVLRFLGRGGMGEVYLVADEAVRGVRVALKTIRPDLAGNPRILEQFRQELQLAREVTHPNVCRIYDLFQSPSAGDDGDLVFLTMEFVPGETLAQRLRREGSMAEADALPVVRQVAEGLSAAHQCGVIHRDLKSGNIILAATRSGAMRAVVMDFGIAESVAEDASRTEFAAGTPDYMSPEQRRGDRASIQSDIYSLGVVAHEMVTGMRPIAARDGWIRPAAVAPGLTARWDKAILRCLAFAPSKRFAGALDFVAALEPPKVQTRRRILISVGATAVVTGALGLSGKTGKGVMASNSVSLAVAPFRAEGGEPRLASLGEALAGEVIAGFTAVRIPYIAGEESTRILARYAAAPATGAGAGQDQDRRLAREAGRRLRVRYVLTGSVSQSGPDILVKASLRSAGTGDVLWAQSFHHHDGDLSQARVQLASAVAGALHTTLRSGAAAMLAQPQSSSAEAYEKYLLGRSLAARRSAEQLAGSIGYFQEAIRLDPAFAHAYAALAASHNILAGRPGHPLGEAFAQARAAAEKALDLMPELGEAHVVLASVYQRHDWNWPESDRHYRAAIAFHPNLPVAHQWYAGLLSIERLPEQAIAEAARARELDPLSLPPNTAYGGMLYRARRYTEAVRQLEFTLKLDDRYEPAWIMVGGAYGELGDWQAAIAARKRAAELSHGEPLPVSELGYTLGRAGYRDQAIAILTSLEQRWPVERFSPSALANVHKGLGDVNGAFRWLEIAFAQRDPSLTILRADPANDLLRPDPRFARFVRELKL